MKHEPVTPDNKHIAQQNSHSPRDLYSPPHLQAGLKALPLRKLKDMLNHVVIIQQVPRFGKGLVCTAVFALATEYVLNSISWNMCAFVYFGIWNAFGLRVCCFIMRLTARSCCGQLQNLLEDYPALRASWQLVVDEEGNLSKPCKMPVPPKNVDSDVLVD